MDVGDLYNKIIGKDLAPPKLYYDTVYRYESFNFINLSENFKMKLSKCGLYYDINAKKFVCIFCKLTMKILSKKSINAHKFSKTCPMSLQLLSTNPSLRKSSFDQHAQRDFVSSERQRKLVDNGFFYTGKRDEMCCAHCGLIIVKLHDDDCVENIHKMYSPRCIFVIKPSAPPLHELPSFAQADETTSAMAKMVISDIDRENVDTEHKRLSVNVDDKDSGDEKKPFVRIIAGDDNKKRWNDGGDNDDDDDDADRNDGVNVADEESLCKICFVNNRQICFFPCRHIMACSECADRCKRCCVCREKIKSKISVYLQ